MPPKALVSARKRQKRTFRALLQKKKKKKKKENKKKKERKPKISHRATKERHGITSMRALSAMARAWRARITPSKGFKYGSSTVIQLASSIAYESSIAPERPYRKQQQKTH
jgi:hypothetical protein